MKTTIRPGIKAEQETAFRQGYTDNAHGIKRDACPYELGKDMNDLRRKWWEGWDKGEKGLNIKLPKDTRPDVS